MIAAGWPVASDQLTVIRAAPSAPVGDAASTEISRGSSNPYLLYVGALEPRKGIDTLAEAIPIARSAGLTAPLVVVGEGRLASEIEGVAGIRLVGRQSDEQASRLILTADVGIIPFKVEPFNDAGLPNRILKYARLGRRTISPMLSGVTSWAPAVTRAADADEFAAALLEQAGARTRPDSELREWAIAQTARRQNEPLWQRLQQLGVTRDS